MIQGTSAAQSIQQHAEQEDESKSENNEVIVGDTIVISNDEGIISGVSEEVLNTLVSDSTGIATYEGVVLNPVIDEVNVEHTPITDEEAVQQVSDEEISKQIELAELYHTAMARSVQAIDDQFVQTDPNAENEQLQSTEKTKQQKPIKHKKHQLKTNNAQNDQTNQRTNSVVDDRPNQKAARIYNADGITKIDQFYIREEFMFQLRAHENFPFAFHIPADQDPAQLRKRFKAMFANGVLPEEAQSYWDFIGRFILLNNIARAVTVRGPRPFAAFHECYMEAVAEYAKTIPSQEKELTFAETGDPEFDQFLKDIYNFNWSYEETDSRMEYQLSVQLLERLYRTARERAWAHSDLRYSVAIKHVAQKHGVTVPENIFDSP